MVRTQERKPLRERFRQIQEWILTAEVAFLLVAWALIAFLMPIAESMENHEVAQLAETAQGRLSISCRTVLAMSIVSWLPAGFIYVILRWGGSDPDETPRVKRARRWAKFCWLTLVGATLAGGITFWLGLHPFQLLAANS